MEAEASLFESSEMLATLMASTPLLTEAWRLCRLAYTLVPWGFAIDQVGEVGYIAFSGLQSVGIELMKANENNGLVPIDTRLFSSSASSFRGCEGDQDPPMVHAGFLHLFLSVYNSPDFQSQIVATLEKSKAIIVTGHSIGGTTASLATLWLLSYLQSLSSNLSILCITFGSPLLGNSSLSKAILRERWGGKFCHVVSKNDIVPRLLFAPITPNIVPQLNSLLHLWLMPMTSLHLRSYLETQISNQDITKLYRYVLAHLEAAAATTQEDLKSSSPYTPFGSYLFFSKEGSICLDNATAIVQMLYLMFMDGTASSSMDDHLGYGEVVMRDSLQFLKKRCFTNVVSKSSYEVGISSALEASGLIANHQESSVVVGLARECLMKARQMGRTPNLNSANLAIRLAKITPYRAQIEWFKACCDESDDLMGYYDTFKLGGASKRNSKVNMNRIKLANFWDDVIHMLETNQLPHDFHKRAKWVNASQFYKLLVEPLDIAYYYRSGMHRTKGHYLTHGRERRYEVFDRWWRGRNVSGQENNKRSKYAGLTQDSCFWARVEEAREWVESAGRENDVGKLDQLWENIEKFEFYARKLVESKEVSKDVEARNSSYSLWLEDFKELKLQLRRTPLQFPGFSGGQMVP